MSFKIHELGEEERYNRENRAVPTSPFRRKVNFSEENFWCYCSSWYSWIINCQLDQTPLSYISPGKYTFVVKGVKTLKGIDDKRQITARFAASMSGESLPIQVIYEGKTRRCLPKYAFPENFDTTFSGNRWSNTEKAISFLKKVAFTHFKNVHQTKCYANEQMSFVLMDTSKGQHNEDVAKLCPENNCVLIIVPHNLTNKF